MRLYWIYCTKCATFLRAIHTVNAEMPSECIDTHFIIHTCQFLLGKLKNCTEENYAHICTHIAALICLFYARKKLYVNSHDFQNSWWKIIKNIANTQFLLASHYHRTILFTFYMQIIHFLIAKFSFNQKNNFSHMRAFECGTANMQIALNTFVSGERKE